MTTTSYSSIFENAPIALSSIPADVFFQDILSYSILSLFVLGLGLLLAYLLWGTKTRKIQVIRDEGTRITTRLNHMIEEQNGMISSLNNRFEVEQKRLGLQLSNKDKKLEELTASLVKFDEGGLQADLAARDEHIRTLQAEIDSWVHKESKLSKALETKHNEFEQLQASMVPDDSLKVRVGQLESILNDRDIEIRRLNDLIENLNFKHDGEIEEWSNALGAKEKELGETLQSRDTELSQLRNELSANDGMFTRLEELEALLGERDLEIANKEKELSEHRENAANGDSEKVEELNGLLASQDEELKQVIIERDTFRDELQERQTRHKEKTVELEDLLGERESVIVALRNDLSDLEDKGERLLHVEELLDERNEKIALLETELEGFLEADPEQTSQLEAELKKRESDFNNLKNQHQNSKKEWEVRVHEIKDQLIARDAEVKSLRTELAPVGDLKKRVSELEWILGEKEAELEKAREEKQQDSPKIKEQATRIEELEYLIWERDSTLETLRTEKQALGEQLKERDETIESLHHKKINLDTQLRAKAELHSRVEDLGRLVREREGELERLWTENDGLKLQLRTRENSDSASIDALRSKIKELEWNISERDTELDRTKFEKSELELKLRNIDSGERANREGLYSKIEELEWKLKEREVELEAIQFEHSRRTELQDRLDELEWSLKEKNREIDRLKASAINEEREPKWRTERSAPTTDDDLLFRVRELERQLSDQDNGMRELRSNTRIRDNGIRGMKAIGETDYRFTLEDGTVVYLKGDEKIQYGGRTHTAAELYKELGDRF